jgi:hypothetical protein
MCPPRPHSPGARGPEPCVSSRASGFMGALILRPRGDCCPIQTRCPCIIAPRVMNRLPAARQTRSEIVPIQFAALQSKPRHPLRSDWQASARGSPDYSSSRRCNRLVTSQAAGASSGTASRISQTVTSRGQENPLKRPAESPLSCHRRGRRMLAKSIPSSDWWMSAKASARGRELLDRRSPQRGDQGSLAISINNFGDACLVIRGRR